MFMRCRSETSQKENESIPNKKASSMEHKMQESGDLGTIEQISVK